MFRPRRCRCIAAGSFAKLRERQGHLAPQLFGAMAASAQEAVFCAKEAKGASWQRAPAHGRAWQLNFGVIARLAKDCYRRAW